MLKTALRSTLILASLGVASAHAADTNGSQKDQAGASSASSAQGQSGSLNVKQEIQTSLSRQGYTDVSVMPTSFLVHAKTPQGQPVAMIIRPDSVTTVTEMPSPGQPGSTPDPKQPNSK